MSHVLVLFGMALGLLATSCESSGRCFVSGFAFIVSPVGNKQMQGLNNHRRVPGSRSILDVQGRTDSTHRKAASSTRVSMAQDPLILTEENVVTVLQEAKQELGTLFGNRAENTEVGITGDVEFVGLDGPSVVVRLTGRFWHAKADVLARVANFVLTRIPECVDVEIEDPAQLEDADPKGRGEAAEL